jgi:predicted anti-sigma-YlaC factor YlaD
MHRLIKERLEELLSAPGTGLPAAVEEHLASCRECREALRGLEEQAGWLGLLRGSDESELAPGFYARVTERIEAQQGASLWNAFLEPAFGRRLLTASLTLTLALGSYLVFREAEAAYAAPAPEAIMAVEEHPPGLGTDPQQDRETILVTLATYRE